METITNKIRCFIWKREFVLGSGFPILPTLKVTTLGDEIVMEKCIQSLCLEHIHCQSLFMQKLSRTQITKTVFLSEGEALEYFLYFAYHFH